MLLPPKFELSELILGALDAVQRFLRLVIDLAVVAEDDRVALLLTLGPGALLDLLEDLQGLWPLLERVGLAAAAVLERALDL